MSPIDPITLEVIKNKLDSIADQIALVLMRSAYSPIVRDSLDYSTAVCDRNGRFIAQGLTTALHLGSFPHAMAHLVATEADSMQPGDVFAFNDPYGSGGMHLPDIYLIKPVFFEGRVEGYATALVHHADIGGIAPGAMAVYATEIFQEGLRIPLTKLYSAGQRNDTLFRLIEANVRIPYQVLGDLRAQLAGVMRGEQGLLELLEQHGSAQFGRYCDALHAAAEQAMRDAIAAIPDGDYEHVDYIDGLGETPDPIRFQVRISIRGSEAHLDWTGTSPQVRAAINAPMPFVRSGSYLPFRCLAGQGIPNAEGYTRPIHVEAPPGSIVNPVLPAAANARGIVGFRVADTVFGALAKAVPHLLPAGGEGGALNFAVGGQHDGAPYVFGESTMGAWGARPDRDGVDGAANPAANQSNQPIELIEAQNPLRIHAYGFITDSGGAGRFRGGASILRRYEFLADNGLLTFRTDRRSFLPEGQDAGFPGTPNLNVLTRSGATPRLLPVLPMEGYAVGTGDVFDQVVPGGGGYGDPMQRDPEQVLEDVLDERFTVAFARNIFGVAIVGGSIDSAETARLRAARGGSPKTAAQLFRMAVGRLVPAFAGELPQNRRT